MRATEPHLAKPLKRFLTRAAVFALATVLLFAGVERYMPQTGTGRSIVAGLPGLALAAWLYLLYAYLKHYDEMLRALIVRALAFCATVGLVTLFTSLIRADIGGYPQFDAALVIGVMGAAFVGAALWLKRAHR